MYAFLWFSVQYHWNILVFKSWFFETLKFGNGIIGAHIVDIFQKMAKGMQTWNLVSFLMDSLHWITSNYRHPHQKEIGQSTSMCSPCKWDNSCTKLSFAVCAFILLVISMRVGKGWYPQTSLKNPIFKKPQIY